MWSIVIHGGAGLALKEKLAFPEQEYHEALQRATSAGADILAKGGSSVDAVVAAIIVLEDSPLFNAGRGSVLNCQGEVEMDAGLMDSNQNSGAVACIKRVRNPILAARLVKDQSPHCFLAGSAVDEFAASKGLDLESPDYFVTPHRVKQLQETRALDPSLVHLDHDTPNAAATQPGTTQQQPERCTVGAVAYDVHGNLAAGTSTGGLCNKWAGRIGGVPLMGSGTFATPLVAISCTGQGESFIQKCAAARVAIIMEETKQRNAEPVVHRVLDEMEPGSGGMIAVDSLGNPVMYFTTGGMFRAFQTSASSVPVSQIW